MLLKYILRSYGMCTYFGNALKTQLQKFFLRFINPVKLQCRRPFWVVWASHSERPVESEVRHRGPTPWIGSPVGNQACIAPRLL